MKCVMCERELLPDAKPGWLLIQEWETHRKWYVCPSCRAIDLYVDVLTAPEEEP